MKWALYQGRSQSGDVNSVGPATQAMWLGAMVFDGARAFEGTVPDLMGHFPHCVQSALALGLEPAIEVDEMFGIAIESVRHRPSGTEFYIGLMIWEKEGDVVPDPRSTRFALSTDVEPIPKMDPDPSHMADSSCRGRAR